jgi:PAS domain S-box-containing protein
VTLDRREGIPQELARDLIDAFVRLARADFTVRLTRNYRRDTEDVLALFVNLIAEELDRLFRERERSLEELEQGVAVLSEAFLQLAAGNFAARAPRSEKGDPIDVLAYLFNNTAAEVGDAFDQLERQRTVLAAILDSMIDGVLLLDAEGRVLRANPAAARLLGENGGAALVGRTLASLVAPAEQGCAEGIAEAVGASPIRDRPVPFVGEGGQRVELSVSASPQRDATGALVGVVLLARDDRELRQAQARLQMTDRLATMGTVAAGVAHEVNNPLAFVLGNLEFSLEELDALEGRAPTPEQLAELRKALLAARSGAERVRGIVRDLKGFSRIDEEAVSTVDLNKLVESALAMLRSEVRRRARLVRELGAPPPVVGNEARLVQVFLNLVQNAAQAIEEGAPEANAVVVSTGQTEVGEAFVAVRDTGAGIAEEQLPHVFEAFYTTKPIGVGTGLGLSIVHRIVTSHGGRIEVESKVGVGSTFRVILPTGSSP